MIDYKFKDEYGDLSAKIYIKADCIKMRFKWLKLSYHKDSMGKDMVLDVLFDGEKILPGQKIPMNSEVDLILGNGKR